MELVKSAFKRYHSRSLASVSGSRFLSFWIILRIWPQSWCVGIMYNIFYCHGFLHWKSLNRKTQIKNKTTKQQIGKRGNLLCFEHDLWKVKKLLVPNVIYIFNKKMRYWNPITLALRLKSEESNIQRCNPIFTILNWSLCYLKCVVKVYKIVITIQSIIFLFHFPFDVRETVTITFINLMDLLYLAIYTSQYNTKLENISYFVWKRRRNI